jgi:periplasmic divalent cation tolerance protein
VSGRLVVLSTVGSAEHAERIARSLVERSLAACVNVVPSLLSTYRWKGEVQRDSELLLIIKTRAERLHALQEALVALHPYEVPEAIALPITAGHRPYLEWLDAAVGRGRPPRRRPRPARGRRSGPTRPRSQR